MITLKKFKQLLTDDHDYLSKILNEKQRLSPPVIEYVINIYDDDYLVKFFTMYNDHIKDLKNNHNAELDILKLLISHKEFPILSIHLELEFFSQDIEMEHLYLICENPKSCSETIIKFINNINSDEFDEDSLYMMLESIMPTAEKKYDAILRVRELGGTFDDGLLSIYVENLGEYTTDMAMKLLQFFVDDEVIADPALFQSLIEKTTDKILIEKFLILVNEYDDNIVHYVITNSLQYNIVDNIINQRVMYYFTHSTTEDDLDEEALYMLLCSELVYEQKKSLLERCKDLDVSAVKSIIDRILLDCLHGKFYIDDSVRIFLRFYYTIDDLCSMKQSCEHLSVLIVNVMTDKLLIEPSSLELDSREYKTALDKLHCQLESIDITKFNEILSNLLNINRFEDAINNLNNCRMEIARNKEEFNILMEKIRIIKENSAIIMKEIVIYNKHVEEMQETQYLVSERDRLVKNHLYTNDKLKEYIDRYDADLSNKMQAVEDYIIDTKTYESLFKERRQQFMNT